MTTESNQTITRKPGTSKPGTSNSAGGSETNTPETMRAVTARRYGTPEVISVEDIPVPSPREGQVLVQVEASSLNALDWHFLTGTPYFLRLMAGLRKPKRLTPGSDVAGTIVAVGADVTDFQPGQPVFGEVKGGGCGQYLLAKPANLVPMPSGVSMEDAAATPVAGLTAVQGLRTHAAMRPGDHVLINGAAGGVGTFAVQIAKAMGGHVTAVCSTRNVEMVRALGADNVIDYTIEDFAASDAKYDVMMDNVGNRTAAECLSVLRPDARYVLISGPKDNPWLDPLPKVIRTALSFRRAKPSFHQFTAEPNAEDLAFLAELLASGKIKPQVQRVIGLDGVAEALREIGTGHVKAKIVVVPGT